MVAHPQERGVWSGHGQIYYDEYQSHLNHPCTSAGSSGSCPNCTGVDKLTALADAKNQTTSYSYDLLSRLVSETDPLGKSTNYNYDAAGNLTSKTDAIGITIGYAYDNQDFLGLFFLQLALDTLLGVSAQIRSIRVIRVLLPWQFSPEASMRFTVFTASYGLTDNSAGRGGLGSRGNGGFVFYD